MPTGPVRPPGTFSPWVLWKGLAPVFLCGPSCYSALAVGQGPSGCFKDVDVSTKPLFSISVSQTPDLMQLRNQPTNRLPHLHAARPTPREDTSQTDGKRREREAPLRKAGI
uniref:Uncharacterized protein n=1 Tax=Rhinopithecus roxellana TaxID=61622 RepID=A0A2K6RSL8_RHIRO